MNRTTILFWGTQLLALLVPLSSAKAEWSLGKGRVWVGPPANPQRYYYATDNGIPGTGHYAYYDYNWPSLRQALDQYGWFGRRYREPQKGVGCSPSVVYPGQRRTIDFRSAAEETVLPPPRKLAE